MNKSMILLLSGLTSVMSLTAKGNETESITFYRVPLQCGAAANLGCGSRAKPALLEMEQNRDIQEAWLNHEGTVYAIVWNTVDQTDAVAKPIFHKYHISYTKLKGNEAEPLLSDFRQQGKWYRGSDVDQLSIEEAGYLAESAVDFLVKGNRITEDEANDIKADVEAYFRLELVKIRTLEELANDSETTFQAAVIAIYKKNLGKERTDEIMDSFCQNIEESKAKGKDCCDKKGQKKCAADKKRARTVALESTITCPQCGHKQTETMPTDACLYFYKCSNCNAVLKPLEGDCCVFCSYGTVKCPPIQ